MFFPLVVEAGSDPLSTEKYIEPGMFPQTADPGRCDKGKISSPLTLSDVVDLALCNNPQTHTLWINARAQAANVGVGMSAYLPTLSAQASESRNFSNSAGQTTNYNNRSIGLTAGYLLFDFGGRSGTLENAKQLLVAANATRDAMLQVNFLAAVQDYYALLSARANVEALQVAEASARESFAAADARYLAGVATPVDKLQAQTALSQARLNLITAQGNVRTAQGTLANIMGFDASIPFSLLPLPESTPDPVVEQDIGKLIEQARLQRPDLLAADAQIKAELQVEGKVAARDLLANQIALDVWKAYQTMLTSSQSLTAADDLVTSAEQSERMTLGRYKAGVANMSILDVLNAQSTLASARQQRVTALYNFKSSRLALAQAIGQLDLTRLDAGN